MADFQPETLVKRQEALAADRAVWESHWQEIAELTRPMRAEFTGSTSPGSKRTSKIYDGTAGMAADNLASGLWGMATNGGTEWFQLRHELDALNAAGDVARWLDDCTQRMRAALNADGQQFYGQADEFIADLVSFGTAVFYSEERPQLGRMRYQCRHLAECFIAENEAEVVDTLYRRFQWTARQAALKWPDSVSAETKRAAEKEPERKFWYLHAVLPRDDFDPRRTLSPQGKRWASYYVEIEGGRRLLGEGGYHEFPYQVARWSKASRGLYGDSPAMLALPDIKMVNAMSKATIIGAQKRVDPALLAPDEGVIRGIRTAPGQIVYGGVDQQGRQLVHPLQTGADVNLGLELEDQRRTAIREAFFYSLMMMAGPPYRTATEVLIQQEEKMRVMGPQLARLQTEFLDPFIGRLFAVMFRANAFAPPPPVLAQYPTLSAEYVSPLARAQKAQRGAATVRALQAVQPIAALDPSAMDVIDVDATVRDLADAFGMPAKNLRDPKAVAQVRAQRQQQAQMAMLADKAGAIGAGAKNLALAGQTAVEMTRQPAEAAA